MRKSPVVLLPCSPVLRLVFVFGFVIRGAPGRARNGGSPLREQLARVEHDRDSAPFVVPSASRCRARLPDARAHGSSAHRSSAATSGGAAAHGFGALARLRRAFARLRPLAPLLLRLDLRRLLVELAREGEDAARELLELGLRRLFAEVGGEPLRRVVRGAVRLRDGGDAGPRGVEEAGGGRHERGGRLARVCACARVRLVRARAIALLLRLSKHGIETRAAVPKVVKAKPRRGFDFGLHLGCPLEELGLLLVEQLYEVLQERRFPVLRFAGHHRLERGEVEPDSGALRRAFVELVPEPKNRLHHFRKSDARAESLLTFDNRTQR
mmetsp:Transcript_18969/g.61843  ORF Transcript_18969/g.61843 Transcript_18969/m.61843 type:complete len:325 (-) Transcript_18969:701-1675(-)